MLGPTGEKGRTTPVREGDSAMKRDMDVIVELLLQLEAKEAGLSQWHPRIQDVADPVVKEHLLLMEEAGLVDFQLSQALRGRWSLLTPRLLNRGHDFLEAMRTPERRGRVADWAGRIGRTLTIELVLAYVRSVIGE